MVLKAVQDLVMILNGKGSSPGCGLHRHGPVSILLVLTGQLFVCFVFLCIKAELLAVSMYDQLQPLQALSNHYTGEPQNQTTDVLVEDQPSAPKLAWLHQHTPECFG